MLPEAKSTVFCAVSSTAEKVPSLLMFEVVVVCAPDSEIFNL